MCSIEDLLIEIIYRIFDNIDINFIISFSLTCKRFLFFVSVSNKKKLSNLDGKWRRYTISFLLNEFSDIL